MKLTMNQMQQQALYAAQHKKCVYKINVDMSFSERGTSLSFWFFNNKNSGEKAVNYLVFNDDCVDEFNKGIKAINGEIDPFEEKNINE